jgi:hypothetical protein
MAGIVDFNSKKLTALLDEFGLHQAWLNILATRIAKNEVFSYMLKDKQFDNCTILDGDLIEGLSVGEIGVLYEYSLSSNDTESRKDNGQFFTPDDVAVLLAGHSKEFGDGKWLDPCSGIGNLSWHLVNMQKNKEHFATNCLILADKDELALFIARVLFTLSFQEKDKDFFNTIKKNFVRFDFLSVANNGVPSLFATNSLSLIPEHDFVIVNPPYLEIEKPDSRFETEKCKDLYAYFLENIIKTSKGFISITPQSFTNAGKFYSLRKLLLDNYPNITIYNFDNIPDNIFHGIKFGSKNTNKANSIRVAITIALQSPKIRRITSLLRWQSSERKKMLSNLDLFLSEVELTPDYFPKVNKVFEPIFNELDKSKTLGQKMSDRETNFALYIPSSPRYFIPALKKSVKRSSLKTIYFHNESDLNIAYVEINSSLMYWWWRVRDGGMTLSLETLKSLPLLDFIPSNEIIKKIETSEKENKVYKMNAGAMQENVKHPLSLLSEINNQVIPKYSDQLLKTHLNSELEQMCFL